MGYRLQEHRPPMPNRTVANVTTPIRLFMHNGTSASFAFPCWYQEILPPIPARIHDQSMHDHHGWPDPDHPDHICQVPSCNHHYHHHPRHLRYELIPEDGREHFRHLRKFINYKQIVPIHLRSDYEGYNDVGIVAWVQQPEGVVASASVDEVEDWVVRFDVSANDPNALEEPQVYKFSVFLDSDVTHRRDLVVLAELVILPAACVIEGEQEGEQDGQ